MKKIGFTRLLAPAAFVSVNVFPLMSAAVLSRFLDPVDLGRYLLAYSFAYFITLADLGVGNGLIQSVGQGKDFYARSRYFSSGLTISFVISSVIMLSAIPIVFLLDDDNRVLYFSVIIQIAVMNIMNTTFVILRLLNRPDLKFKMQILFSLSLMISSVVTAMVFKSSRQVAFYGALSTIFIAIFTFIIAKRISESHGIRLRVPDLYRYRELFKIGSATFVHNIFGAFFTFGQRILIGALAGPFGVASVFYPQTLISKMHQYNAMTSEVFFIEMSSSKDESSIKKIYSSKLKINFIASISISLLFLFLGNQIFAVWLGSGVLLESVENIYIYYIFAYFFYSLTPMPYYLLNSLGMQWKVVVFDVIYAATFGLMILINLNSVDLVYFSKSFAGATCIYGAMMLLYANSILKRKIK
ncbi:lipopolysaccharide biosynthesis protein [Deinococcus sp. 6GRE01]|uniref:lipopolysaccharide biosynthesis protein n=1 Tax=Deinococcus sp. 6GRE01 TaxID=2745873 RepID=UPI001E48A8C9|nr:oligosaccharide flippase family protein [Deinococcus sp. 6GRE01]MCD0156953.1 oligosaccharide flippase family protein [Deinococcus sp. 6GRE01]